MLFDRIRQNADAIRRMGTQAIAEARRLGVPSHYVDPSVGDGIVREMPDGTKQIVRLDERAPDGCDGSEPRV